VRWRGTVHVLRVRIGLVLQQQSGDLAGSRVDRSMQRTAEFRVTGFQIGRVAQPKSDGSNVAVEGRQVKRDRLRMVGLPGSGSVRQQHLHNVCGTSPRRKVQGR
jgi:hypothetical protein